MSLFLRKKYLFHLTVRICDGHPDRGTSLTPAALPLQEETGWEEYFDYIFPEDEAARPNLKLLQMAKLWRKQQQDPEPEASSDAAGAETAAAGPAGGAEETTAAEEGGTPPGTPPPPAGADLPEDIDRDDPDSPSSDSSSESEDGGGA